LFLAVDIAGVQGLALLLPNADSQSNPTLSQLLNSFSTHPVVRIHHPNHDLVDARRLDRLCTRWLAAHVTTGLERHIQCGTASFCASLGKHHRLCVRSAIVTMPAPSKHSAVLDKNGTHTRIGGGPTEPGQSRFEREAHEAVILMA